MSDIIVRVENLRKQFDGFEAVKGISFEMHRGEVCGFLGPNGAGKTTTMRIMATIEMPTDGDVWISSYSVSQHPDFVRHKLGFMPDQYGHYENLTCDEYLDFFARAYGYKGQDRLKRIEAVIEFTGMGPIRDKLMTALSKGMKQRLCLGRTLIHDPDVMLLDEPAAGLDPRARAELKELIKILSTQGKTILVSSHILTELADMCTHVAIIERGVLKAKGPIGRIQKDMTPRNQYRIRVLENPEITEHFLVQQPFVRDVSVSANELTFVFESNEKDYASLLKALVTGGFPLIESRLLESNLEQAFLALTSGEME